MENSNNHLMNYVIDRYEGEYAVLVDTKGRQFDVLSNELPEGSAIGDIFNYSEGIFICDVEATKIARDKIEDIKANIVRKN